MIKKTLCLIGVFFIASCTFNNEKETQLLSVKKVIDRTLPNYEICENFQLTEKEIISFFQVAQQVSNEEEHGQSFILPCKYEGKLIIKKKIYSYEVFAGGTGYIYDENGWVAKNFICKNNNCCSKFSALC